ncbi:MAG: hypothetical protein HWE07_10155 [Cytophagia bacterium]|nr:hypothetical protein [Cytophagia bacterium]
MRFHTLTIVLLCLSFRIQAQNEPPQVVEIQDKKLIELMNGLSGDRHIYSSDFSAKIFEKKNPAGSADLEGTHGITSNYLIAISESDDYPTQSLFEIKEFFAPEIIFVVGSDNAFIIRIKHLLKGEWTFTQLKVEKHSVKIL